MVPLLRRRPGSRGPWRAVHDGGSVLQAFIPLEPRLAFVQPAAFVTADGVEVTAVSADEMREVDRVAVRDVGIDLLMMMENAGRDLATHVGGIDAARVTVVAGNGGNGGGGLACARHLVNHDQTVDVVLDRPPDELDGATAHHYRILDAMGVEATVGPTGFDPGDVVVDALVGYGLEGPLRGTAADLVSALGGTDAEVVSLDVPSGIDATTGERRGPAVSADAVLTLALPKTGLRAVESRVFLADIGVPVTVFERAGIEYDSPFRGDHVVEIERT